MPQIESAKNKMSWISGLTCAKHGIGNEKGAVFGGFAFAVGDYFQIDLLELVGHFAFVRVAPARRPTPGPRARVVSDVSTQVPK